MRSLLVNNKVFNVARKQSALLFKYQQLVELEDHQYYVIVLNFT